VDAERRSKLNIKNEAPNASKLPWMDELLKNARAIGFYEGRISRGKGPPVNFDRMDKVVVPDGKTEGLRKD